MTYTEQIVVRLDPELLADLEAYRQAQQASHPGVPYSREATVRELLRKALRAIKPTTSVRF